jgi:hypothetical protein
MISFLKESLILITKSHLMKRLLSFLILLLPFFSFAQSSQFKWSETHAIDNNFSLSSQINNNSFIICTQIGGVHKIEKIEITQDDDSVFCSRDILLNKLANSTAMYTFIANGSDLIKIRTIPKIKGSILSITELDSSFVDLKTSEFESSGFSYTHNDQFLMMYKLIDQKLEIKTIDLERIEIKSEQTIDIPLDYDRIEIIDIRLDNDGSALFGIAPMKSFEKGKKTKDKKDGEFIIVSVNGTSHDIYRTEIEDAHISFGDFVKMNDDIFFVGVTSNGFDQDNLYTLRSFKLNGGENSIEEVGSNDCSGDFLFSGLSDEEKEKLSGKFDDYKKENGFNIPKTGVRAYMKCAEQMRGHKVLIFRLNNAFLVCSLDDKGNFSWLQSIPLNYRTGVGGYLNTKNELIVYFTDVSTNYDESGRFKLNYKEPSKIDRIKGSEDVGVMLTIDIFSGDYTREVVEELIGYSIIFPAHKQLNEHQVIVEKSQLYENQTFGVLTETGMKILTED